MTCHEEAVGDTVDLPFREADTARAVVDHKGVVTSWNEGARQLLGFTAPEVVGRPATELLAEVPGSGPSPGSARWDGLVKLRHRDGRNLALWLLAHRRRPDLGDRSEWLIVHPLTRPAPEPVDSTLMQWAFTQSPCAVAIYDHRLRLRKTNDEMNRVIGLPEEHIQGLRLPEIGGKQESDQLERDLLRVLTSGRREIVQTYMRTGGEEHAHAWSARIAPLVDAEGQVQGVYLGAHDVTEQYLARQRLLLVNAASERIGSSLDITRTAQELADVCVPSLADFVSVDLCEPFDQGDEPRSEPITPPVVLRRVAQQSVLEGCPESAVGIGRTDLYSVLSSHADSLMTGRTSRYGKEDLADHGWPEQDSPRAVRARDFGVHSIMSVPIRARGTTLGVAVFLRHRRPGSFTEDDVLLAEEVTTRAAVCLDNARRFTRERETALALQRSLLPKRLPRTAALDVASGYLPAARSGVGGDWFDVIPLSGMRVAMVVGDVVGHGLRASATMGRLRTAVRTLADVDLAPDELLTRLDDLVVQLAAEDVGEGETGDGGEDGTDIGLGELGATCLYAVYDPVSCRFTVARAGHPPPVVVTPAGRPELLDVPAGPPLGVGGLPFEATELDLPEGTMVALFTDGLIESRERDIDEGARLLCDTLATPAPSLDGACARVLETMLREPAHDDVALLLARTRALDSSCVAVWDVNPEPEFVSQIRRLAVKQLATWGLDDAAYVTELIVSELVTNAIRYGKPPVQLRLLLDRTLLCEVSDASSTAPHLRRARTYDEGGRGLLLVAQLSQRWGCRHTSVGKTIWAEQTLPGR